MNTAEFCLVNNDHFLSPGYKKKRNVIMALGFQFLRHLQDFPGRFETGFTEAPLVLVTTLAAAVEVGLLKPENKKIESLKKKK